MFDFNFDWNDDMCTNIPSLDEQHKELFRIGRDIEQLLLTRCIGVETQQLLDIVCELREYTAYNYYEEERIMKENGYADYEKHIEEHHNFINQITNIDCPAMARAPYEELKKLKDIVQDWVFEHMLKEDLAMAREINRLK